MSDVSSHKISSEIDENLAALPKTSNQPFIFRIHHNLRRENERAYEPQMLSIGPYHHSKENLQKLEKYKLEFLQGILERRNEASAERYVAALMEVEEEARSCYAEDVSLKSNEFVKMMLLDGCFIIEFLRKCQMKDDDIFSMGWLHHALRIDLLLFENQLPFLILVTLFDMTKICEEEDLIHLAKSCLNHNFIAAVNPTESSDCTIHSNDVLHLLSLMYTSWTSSAFRVEISKPEQNKDLESQQTNKSKHLEFIKSVSELKEYGVKFRKAEKSKPWFDIKFENGVVEIPTLVVDDSTEYLLRNLIVYEEYLFGQDRSRKFVTNYAAVMDRLISSSKDVKMLRDQKIIENWLGDDEVVSNMFNKICNHVIFYSSEFSYKELFQDVNEHCRKRHNKWIAVLNRDYFNHPWSIISFLAATALLLLTLIQAVNSFH